MLFFQPTTVSKSDADPHYLRQTAAIRWLTSQVLDEVLELHLPLRLDVGAVHVRVEEDDGKGQDEDGVGVPKLSHHCGIADAVALAGNKGLGEQHHPFHLTTKLGLHNETHPKDCLPCREEMF